MNRPIDICSVDLGNAPDKLRRANKVALFGNGGNLAVAQHMASDIFRHTGKFCYAPDSVNTTALANQSDWKVPWMEYAQYADLVIGITCRKGATVAEALMSIRNKCDTLLICPQQHDTLDTLVIPAISYHQFEVYALWTIYMLMEEIGVDLPKLPHIMDNISKPLDVHDTSLTLSLNQS